MIHSQGVDHVITHSQHCLCTLFRWMIASKVVEKNVLDTVSGEVEKDGSAAGDQADQDAENDWARQKTPVDFF